MSANITPPRSPRRWRVLLLAGLLTAGFSIAGCHHFVLPGHHPGRGKGHHKHHEKHHGKHHGKHHQNGYGSHHDA